MASFRSTYAPPNQRPIGPGDALLVDPSDGSPVGIRNPNANGNDGYFYPIPLTAAQIASPSAAILADTKSTFCLNVAPYTRYMSDGDELVGLAGGTITNPIGIFANLSTVPSGTPQLTIDANSQALIYAPFTVQSSGGVVVAGQLRVVSWPA